MKNIFLFTLALLATLTTQAQTTSGEIRGYVTDSITNEPIAGAMVSINYKGQTKGAITDFDGLYSIKPIDPGTYSVTINFIGKPAVTLADITVGANKTRSLNYAYGANIKEIVIFSESDDIDMRESPGKISIPAKDYFTNAGGRNPGDVITTFTPGAVSIDRQPKAGNISFRGGRGDATLYIIDGVKVIGDAYVPSIAVEDMTVITGGLPASYGDTTSGVVIITTKSFR